VKHLLPNHAALLTFCEVSIARVDVNVTTEPRSADCPHCLERALGYYQRCARLCVDRMVALATKAGES
jgi:hypothetical protein